MAFRHALLKMQARLEFCNELKSNVAGLPDNDFYIVISPDIRIDYNLIFSSISQHIDYRNTSGSRQR